MSDTRASHDGSLLCDMAVLPAVIVYIYIHILLCCHTTLTVGDSLSSTVILRDNKCRVPNPPPRSRNDKILYTTSNVLRTKRLNSSYSGLAVQFFYSRSSHGSGLLLYTIIFKYPYFLAFWGIVESSIIHPTTPFEAIYVYIIEYLLNVLGAGRAAFNKRKRKGVIMLYMKSNYRLYGGVRYVYYILV